MADDLQHVLARRTDAPPWEEQADGVWRLEVDDGRLVGTVTRAGQAFEGRVLRRPTGPSPGPDQVEAHGPQVFDDAADALGYVEANLGLGT